MTAAEFRKLYCKGSLNEKLAMSVQEWRDDYRKTITKPFQKNAMEINNLLKAAHIPFKREFIFHPTRRWRFDFALLDRKIAIEYEGIFSKKSGHTTLKGYISDSAKYNAATVLGWRVLRYTAKNYKQVIEDLKRII